MKKIEKILEKVIKIIFNTIFIILMFVLIILAYNVIQLRFNDTGYMNIFGYSLFQVKTGSMSGTMEIGDIVIVKITKDVKNNDIITFVNDGAIITHRIVDEQGETLITKGDANNKEDEDGITKDNVIGKVVYIIKNVEIWKQVFTTPEVYILVIITLILFGLSISIKEEKKEL